MGRSGQARPRKLDSGRWRIEFMVDGKRHSKTFDKRSDAVAYQRAALVDANRGEFVAPDKQRARVSDRLDAWLELKASDPNFEDSTLRVNRSKIKHHIRPHLGHLTMEQLTIEAIERWRNTLVETAGSSCARSCFGILRAFLSDQKRHGYVATNAAKDVKAPSHRTAEMTFLEPRELRAVVAAMDRPWAADVTLGLAYIGCRIGDLRALAPEDYDRINGRLRVWDHKNKKERRIPVFPALKEVLDRCLERGRGADWLFTTHSDYGQFAINPSHYNSEHLKPALARAGIGRNVRPHDLRHTCASWLIRMGFGPVHVAAYLGHANPTTTMRVYSHLFADDFSDMGDALDQMSRMQPDDGNVTPIRKAK
jgi:integrase